MDAKATRPPSGDRWTDRRACNVQRDDDSVVTVCPAGTVPKRANAVGGLSQGGSAKYRLPQRSRTLCVLGWRQKSARIRGSISGVRIDASPELAMPD